MSERRAILITGGASGMGLATARLFGRQGWFVGALDLSAPGLTKLGNELPPDRLFTARLDVRDRDAFGRVVADFARASGNRCDVLFNNAGIGRSGFFDETPFEEHLAVIQVNLVGVLNGIYSVLPLLKRAPNSLCFTTSSSSATFGMPGIAVYSATKHAVKGLTEALSVEFARFGVRAACVLPGLIDTPILDGPVFGTMADNRPAGGDIRTVAPRDGMWRLTSPDEVAQCVWHAYHEGNRIHYYVPPEIGEIDRAKGESAERARDLALGLAITQLEPRKT